MLRRAVYLGPGDGEMVRWRCGQAAGPKPVLEEPRSSGSGFPALSCCLTLDLDRRCPNEGNEKWQEIQVAFFFL